VRDCHNFKADDAQKKSFGVIPSDFFLIEKSLTEIYDTRQTIEQTALPVKKLRRQLEVCEEDGFKRTRYV